MNKHFGKVLSFFGSSLGRAEHFKLEIYSKNAIKVQESLLRRLLKKNATTEYGKKYNFKDVNSIEDYQKLVPLTYYEDYDGYIQRMLKGEKGLITNSFFRRYAGSSGSTGKAKTIPLSAWSEWVAQCFGFSAPVGCAYKYFKKQGRSLPPQKGLLTAEVSYTKLEHGKTMSCLSSIPLLNIKPAVPLFATSPQILQYTSDDTQMDSHYLKLRFALPRRDVSYLGTIFITTLESMFFYMEENWEMLCDDIEKGIINESIVCPPEMRAKLEKKLKPNPKRAEELRKEFRKGFDDEPIVPRIWPNISWMYGMGTGAIAIYQKKLQRYMGENVPIHYLGYVASEAMMAVPIELDSYEYVILPQNGFYEFRPVESDDCDNLLTIKDLEVGKEYEIILTNTSGLYRYRIEDVVRVTGFHNQSPKVTFCYRLNQIANISGEKMTQLAFDYIVDQMSEKLDELFIGYSIYADHSTSPGHYVLLLETAKEADKSKEAEYAKLFEEIFSQNPSAECVFRNGSLGHCEVKFLKHGTYDDYRQMLKNRGANLNQVKPIKFIDNEERKEFFFSHIIGE